MSEQITGAQSLVRSLEMAGVTDLFGIPGGAILPAYDPLMDSSQIRHILCRHEQGAGHAAQGYALAGNRVGACIATSGPGATNLVTPIADAYMDSVPMVAITGQVPSTSIGTDAFQEADIKGITMPITKHSYLVTNPDDIPRAVAEAFHIAGTGRPGPVLVDVAKDALTSLTTFNWPAEIDLPGYRPITKPHVKQVKEAARYILESKQPVFYIGGGVIKANAAEELKRLVELTGIPVVTTLMARGVFPDAHPLHLGMPGMHGTVAAVGALQRSDLLITLGARFDDRVTGKLDSFAPDAKVIHADIDPAEIGKNRDVDVPIVGDAREVIIELIAALEAEHANGHRGNYAEWLDTTLGWKQKYTPGYETFSDGSLAPQYVIERLSALSDPDTIFASGVGQHQMWSSQRIGVGTVVGGGDEYRRTAGLSERHHRRPAHEFGADDHCSMTDALMVQMHSLLQLSGVVDPIRTIARNDACMSRTLTRSSCNYDRIGVHQETAAGRCHLDGVSVVPPGHHRACHDAHARTLRPLHEPFGVRGATQVAMQIAQTEAGVVAMPRDPAGNRFTLKDQHIGMRGKAGGRSQSGRSAADHQGGDMESLHRSTP